MQILASVNSRVILSKYIPNYYNYLLNTKHSMKCVKNIYLHNILGHFNREYSASKM